MRRPVGRRRFLSIVAAALVAPGAVGAGTAAWRGSALGAVASITLGGTGRATAEDTFAAVIAELDRLEDIFSLYRPGSALSRLNRQGRLESPPDDLVTLLQLCATINVTTRGAFDPTVQPLWRALAAGRPVASAARLVGWQDVSVGSERIVLARPGMALTLNGIAQGYITDRIAGLLGTRGYRDVLIDIGEIAARGTLQGAAWRADVAEPDGRILQRLRLRDRALAVSAPGGSGSGAEDHILDPRRGGRGPRHRLVAVTADSAALADGLSTGCCLLSDAEARRAVAGFASARIEALY